MQSLFDQYKRVLDHFFTHVRAAEMEALVQRILASPGALLLTGVGKSGLIAQKIAATLVSTGTPASFLSPSGALHGDLGMAREGDLLLGFSKSGASQELLELIPFAHQKKVETVALVSQEGSRLAELCRHTVLLPVLRELCPFDLAPTTSTAVQLIAGDVLAMALMEARGFSVADFAGNHPAGLLGRKITRTVADLMLQGERLPLCRPEDKLIEVLHELSQKRCGCLLVVEEEGTLRGIFTDGDLRRALQTHGAAAMGMRLSELMTSSPKTVEPGRLALEAMQIMEEEPHRLITVLPVLEAGRLQGLLRMHDILQTGLH